MSNRPRRPGTADPGSDPAWEWRHDGYITIVGFGGIPFAIRPDNPDHDTTRAEIPD